MMREREGRPSVHWSQLEFSAQQPSHTQTWTPRVSHVPILSLFHSRGVSSSLINTIRDLFVAVCSLCLGRLGSSACQPDDRSPAQLHDDRALDVGRERLRCDVCQQELSHARPLRGISNSSCCDNPSRHKLDGVCLDTCTTGWTGLGRVDEWGVSSISIINTLMRSNALFA